MADIIKIKPKKSYEWNQDKKFIYLQISLPSHTSLKKVEIYLSDLILRVTSLEKKQTHFLDLDREIDYRSPENKFILTNGLLHATLKKSDADFEWTNLLIEDISLADLKIRRRESEIRYQQNIKQVEENKDKLRTDYDRKATQELMKFEQQERDKLDNKKKIQKEIAIREVFSNVNETTGKFHKQTSNQHYLQLETTENKWKEKQQLAITLLEAEEEKEKSTFQKKIKQKHQNKIIEEVTKQYHQEKAGVVQNNTMFTDQQIDKYEEMRRNIEDQLQFEEIPIRKAGNQTVKFTQRIHKNLAARDHFYKEPPLPKSKENKPSNGDLESKNPLWLKDKGDAFLKDKNYISAIEAYSEALKLDSKLINAVLNRSICYMKVFKVQQALNDCDQSLLLLQSQISGAQEEQVHSRVTLAKIKTRKAICTAWKGDLQASKAILLQVLDLQLDQETKKQVSICMEQIKKRQQSIESKLKGDELIRINNHQLALGYYNKSIQIDQNEYAISNKVLCLNKMKDYRGGSEQAQRGIKKLTAFNLGLFNTQTKEDKQATLILLKLYYRRAKAFEQMGLINEAEDSIRKGLTINSQDKDLQDYLKLLKKKQAKQLIKSLKDESVSLIKESKVKQALQNYSKCLKLLEQNEDMQEYLAILQNQCVCYQKIEKYDDVLSTCIRILKLVNRVESKILGFGDKKETGNIDKEELKKISVRTLVRRANAYVKTNQYYNAKSDLQKALEISPDESIRKELENLKTRLSSEV